ncbi:MAG: cytochrome P450 [Myxococcota bacterium]
MRPASELPGLWPIPLVGRALGFPRLFRDPLRILPQLHREYGEIAALNRGDASLVCAFGPSHNQQLLPYARTFEHFAELPMRVPADSALARTQSNLTAINGQTHRRQRRLMMPAFGKSATHGHRDDMVAVAERHLAQWKPGQHIDIAQAMLELTLDVMTKCLFGLDPGGDAAELGSMGKEFLQRVISPATALLPVGWPFTPYGKLLRLTERLERHLLTMIESRREQGAEGRDVLSILVRAHDEDGSRLTDVELIGNMGLLFVAGHETTAYALTWALLLLAQHPQVRADLHDELSAELHGEAPTVEQLDRLPLLDAVVKESLRLLPPTYMMFVRRATEAFELAGYELPAGSLVVLSPLITHHLPELYDQPQRFVPARWAERKVSPFEFLPFGAGPRLCLGAAFADQEIRLVLAMIMQRFAMGPADVGTIDVAPRGITMGPKEPISMALHRPDEAPRTAATVGGSVRDWVDW